MTLVKICGLTNFADAQVAIDAGADLVGFIFYEKSPRMAEPAEVARIMSAYAGEDRYKTLVSVGVFVHPGTEEVKATLATCGLRAAQLHSLNADEMADMRRMTYGAAFAAVRPRSSDEALTALELIRFDSAPGNDLYRTPGWCPQLLVDAHHTELHGGTGQQANHDAARELVARVPRLVLAGGLTPDNVAEAIRAVRPWAVDVASGVEATPGKKDHGKVRAFIQAVRDTEKEFTR
ncbi:MAG TPA: phosphoribosylanthranilate isomerase [Aggregatilineales bacterium]|nr:phosphoribosylanthranilate isomerase [Aggregatilineales bacterium]